MTVAILENWHCAFEADWDGYTAPEMRARVLVGTVYGHRSKPNGSRITTSRIVSVNGRRVTTASGSIYELGTASERWALHCAELGCEETKPLGGRR